MKNELLRKRIKSGRVHEAQMHVSRTVINGMNGIGPGMGSGTEDGILRAVT